MTLAELKVAAGGESVEFGQAIVAALGVVAWAWAQEMGGEWLAERRWEDDGGAPTPRGDDGGASDRQHESALYALQKGR